LLTDKTGNVGYVEPEGGGDVLPRGGVLMGRERRLGADRGGVGSVGTEREIQRDRERVERYVKGGVTRSAAVTRARDILG